MKTLRKYLNSLSTAEQSDFAARCKTSVGYLRKAISKQQRFDVVLAVAIDRESGGVVRCGDLRPDVDWDYLRSNAAGIEGR